MMDHPKNLGWAHRGFFLIVVKRATGEDNHKINSTSFVIVSPSGMAHDLKTS